MKWVRLSARLITTLWAGFWIFFVVGLVINEFTTYGSEPGSDKIKGIIAGAFLLTVFLGSLYLAWRRPRVAGISLVLIGFVSAGAYFVYVHRSSPVMLILCLPPLVSGAFFLLSGARRQRV
jgi:hypothetical protein